MTETCVCCGEPIPEGRQVCPKCEGLEDHCIMCGAPISQGATLCDACMQALQEAKCDV